MEEREVVGEVVGEGEEEVEEEVEDLVTVLLLLEKEESRLKGLYFDREECSKGEGVFVVAEVERERSEDKLEE